MIIMDFFKPEVKKIQYNHILSESGEKEPSNELFFRSESSIAEKLEVWQSYISGIRRTLAIIYRKDYTEDDIIK
jgi:hypothetical protein